MARPLRIECPDALYHVTSRGDEKRPLFRDDHDFRRRMDWLERTIETYEWLAHAFVLMTNHDHLFVQTPRGNLSAGMQFFNGSYSSYFNARHGRVGHVFQGRYKAILVESRGHYQELSRYIHLNPVRAGLVRRPEEWPWGSCKGYLGPSARLPWITYSQVLGEFGRDEATARRLYRRYVLEGMTERAESPLKEAVHGLILGSEAFVETIRKKLRGQKADAALPQQRRLLPRPSLAQIREAVGTQMGVAPSDWTRGRRSDDIARAVAACVARSQFGYSATETAAALGYSGPSSVWAAINRVTARRENLHGVLRSIEKRLAND